MFITLPLKASENKSVIRAQFFYMICFYFRMSIMKLKAFVRLFFFPLFLKISSEWVDIIPIL